VTTVASLEPEIAEWRSFVGRTPALDGRDIEELEAHLRDQIADLSAAGLAEDEAFLIAVKRMGAVDELSREFAREHSGRLWRQLVVSSEGADGPDTVASRWPEALAFAVAAAVVVQVVRVIAEFPDETYLWFVRNLSLLVLPFLAAWFARRRGLPARDWLITGAVFAVVGAVTNLYPYDHESSTELLVIAHLPVALWFVVAYPYLGGAWREHERRMDFVRFTGEWFIYYVLIALGGGVLVGLTIAVLQPAGIEPDTIAAWVLPTGAAGAVIVAAWLVESKQRVIENMAPVLTMLFTPMFALMLAVAAVAYAVSGLGDAFDRELLGVFDALLVVVLGLVLYGISAREDAPTAGWMDRIQVFAVGCALVLDAMVLVSMISRIGDVGWTPNRAAALGLNLVLLVNLAVSGWWSLRFLTGRTSFHRLERWQTAYLPVFAAWAAVVVVVFPPAFAFS
jgi:hypothetical protein